jgi:S-formylglutathione hydrolase
VILVAPDTSPRGLDLPEEHDAYDFGSGAGFYINATEAPWSANYRMEDYIVRELPEVCASVLPMSGEASIMGHSMGGHGALTLALKNPGMYRSVSAFSPICNPMECQWGQKAFTGYLGEDTEAWKAIPPPNTRRPHTT